jgi:DNA-binding SARP family transcriptional activator
VRRDLESAPASELEAVRIGLLGGFRVSVGTRIIEEKEWRLRKAQNLIKLLALTTEHRLHRERVMELLWPDLDPKATANNLYHTLHVARRVFESEASTFSYLRLHDEQLELSPKGPIWVDVETFEEAAITARRTHDPAAYRVAIELYIGDLLPEDRYEAWAEERREELRMAYLALLVEMASLYEERGEFGPAIEALGRVVASEPTHEEAHVRLIRLYAASDAGRSPLPPRVPRRYRWRLYARAQGKRCLSVRPS